MIILGTNSIKDTGFNVDNSLRTNRGSSDYLNKTFSGSGNRRTFTISFWLKIAESSSNAPYLCGASTSTTNGINIYYNSTSQLSMEAYTGAWSLRLHTSALLRDTSAWYHICYAIDTTQGTEANRVKLYINVFNKHLVHLQPKYIHLKILTYHLINQEIQQLLIANHIIMQNL